MQNFSQKSNFLRSLQTQCDSQFGSKGYQKKEQENRKIYKAKRSLDELFFVAYWYVTFLSMQGILIPDSCILLKLKLFIRLF